MKNRGIYYAIEFFILIVLVFFLSNKLLYIENKSKIETKKAKNALNAFVYKLKIKR